MPQPSPPSLTFVFRADVRVEPALQIGESAGVLKRIFPILGGTVTGPRLTGTVLPGADWQTVAPDGTNQLCARYLIRADDGALIGVTNQGIRRGPPEVLARIMAGEAVDSALYYFRTSPSFDVADGPHRWLAQYVFVCSAARTSDRVVLDFFQVD